MKWISVKDKHPEKDMVCVVHNVSRPCQFYISIYCPYFKEFDVYQVGLSQLNTPITFNATHWMEIVRPSEDV